MTRRRMMCPRSAICHMCWARTNSVVLTKNQWKCSSSWPSLRRTLSKYVTLSVDNLVSLNEQQLVDSVSQRADELKPLGYESLPHFSPKSLLSRPESEDPKVLTSQLYLFFFEFRRIRHRTRMLIPFPARLCALSLLKCNKFPPCLQRKVPKFNRLFLHGIMTPALQSVGCKYHT